MITRRLSILLTSLCCLLAVATSASECAWVLWQESTYFQGTIDGARAQ